MDQLRAMRVFARVVDDGGFAKAARSLDMAPPVVTRLVAELEQHLGARLLTRTTRRLSLTEVGERYLDKVRGILADVDEAAAIAADATLLPRGHLRLLCPPAIAVHQLAKHMPRFQAQYPQVTLEITSPGPVDTIDDSYDITIFASRELPDGDFIARRLARSEVVVCASPDYLDRRGRPQHPTELPDHEAVVPPMVAQQRGLVFFSGPMNGGAQRVEVPMRERNALSTTHIDTMYAAALAGLGIAGLPSYVIEDALLEHALERVLPEWRLFDITLWAGMPSRRYLPARTRVFLDFLLQIFGGEDRDPWLQAAGCATPWNGPMPAAG
ncbi:LysR family transcriptional regulator [Rubrivivax rivuli]|uniref:LysR family transcriptional regulator n=1 Tax=Rubrivivax rivuli TaxID=1862385 RepID=A0A437RQT3_9BURK|nr:LysR family transcriptional regulator [Rubrivivax rivuli]RVU49164.1 LysR family transcriptional regulator [Rubrivivax rivuli]